MAAALMDFPAFVWCEFTVSSFIIRFWVPGRAEEPTARRAGARRTIGWMGGGTAFATLPLTLRAAGAFFFFSPPAAGAGSGSAADLSADASGADLATFGAALSMAAAVLPATALGEAGTSGVTTDGASMAFSLVRALTFVAAGAADFAAARILSASALTGSLDAAFAGAATDLAGDLTAGLGTMLNFVVTSFTGTFATGFEADLTAGLAAALTSGLAACRGAGFAAGFGAAVTFATIFVLATGLLSTFSLTLALEAVLDTDLATGGATVALALVPALVTWLIGAAALP